MSGDYSNSPDYFNQINRTFSAEVLQNNLVQMYNNSDNIMDTVTRNGARSDSGGRGNFGNQARPWMNGGYRGRYGAGPPSRYFAGARFEPPWTPPATCFPPPPPPPPPPPLVPNSPYPELWVEAKSDRGRPYYYHSRTRETTWTRPAESPMCRVVTHEQMEDMATSGAIPELLDPPRHEEADAPRNPAAVAVPPPDFTQPPPWNGQESGIGAESVDYTQSFGPTLPTSANGYPCTRNNQWSGDGPWVGWGNVESSQPRVPMQANVTLPQAMISQLETHTSPPQAPGLPPVYCDNRPPQPKAQPYQPPWPNQPPRPKQAVQPTMAPTAEKKTAKDTLKKEEEVLDRPVAICRPIRPKKAKTKISEELKALAEEWTTHKAPDGHSYYYHAKDKKSVWVKPQPLREYEELKARIAREEAEEERIYKNSKIVDVIDLEETTESDGIKEESLEQEKERLDFASFYETLQKEEKEREAKEREEKERQEREIAEQERKIREDKEREDKEREEKLKKEQEENERQEKIKAENERQEKEKQEKIKAENERQEKEKQENERQEKERLEKERLEKERQAKEKERKEKKRKKKEELTKEDWNKPFMNLPVPGTPWLIVWTVSGGRFFFNSAASHAVWLRPTELAARRDVDLMVARPPPAVVRAKEKYVAAMAAKEAGKPQEDTESNGEDVETIDKSVDAKKRRTCSTEDSITDAYADTPLVEKQQIFRQMLVDNKVSAISTWEKELHKIVFDSRYKLLTNDQRKLVFDKFMQERGPEEKKEKEAAFKQKLEEARPQPNTSYQEFASKHGEDARVTALDKSRAQALFEDHIAELRRKETRRDKAKQDFIAMLKEKNIDRHARWVDIRKRLEADVRCKVVVSNTAREEYFREYCKIVREERRKDKDRASTSIKKAVKKAVCKKDKGSEKADNGESKQPTPPREQWADIIGVPGAGEQRRDNNKSAKPHKNTSASGRERKAATSSRPTLKTCSVTLKKCVVKKCVGDEKEDRTKESTEKKKENSSSVRKVKNNKKSRDESVDSDSSEDLQKIVKELTEKSPPKISKFDKKTTEERQAETKKSKLEDKDLPLIKRRISVRPTDSPESDVSPKRLRSSTLQSPPKPDKKSTKAFSRLQDTNKKITKKGRTTEKRKKNCQKE